MLPILGCPTGESIKMVCSGTPVQLHDGQVLQVRGVQQTMVCAAKLCTSEDSTVDDRFLPLAGHIQDAINSLFCFPIRAVLCPVMDQLQGNVSAIQRLVSLHRLKNRRQLSLTALLMKMGPVTAGSVRSSAEVLALMIRGGGGMVGGRGVCLYGAL